MINLDFIYDVISSPWIYSSIILIPIFVAYFSRNCFNLKNKHVLITGGSSGIGLETAKEYIKNDANITIVARNINKLKEGANLLKEYSHSIGKSHVKILYYSLDVSSSENEVNQTIQRAISEMGRNVDVLVNCAGISLANEFHLTSASDFQKLYQVNVIGSVMVTKAVLEGMRSNKNGRIIFVSSQVAQVAIHGYTVLFSFSVFFSITIKFNFQTIKNILFILGICCQQMGP